jgi:hypothetical protein
MPTLEIAVAQHAALRRLGVGAAAQPADEDKRGSEARRTALQPTSVTVRRADTSRVEIRCALCGYGGVVSRLPDRCPMCGLRAWEVSADVTSHVRRARGVEQDAGRFAAAG